MLLKEFAVFGFCAKNIQDKWHGERLYCIIYIKFKKKKKISINGGSVDWFGFVKFPILPNFYINTLQPHISSCCENKC